MRAVPLSFPFLVFPLSPLQCNWLSQGTKKRKIQSLYGVQMVVHM